jgi:hypothetical protein
MQRRRLSGSSASLQLAGETRKLAKAMKSILQYQSMAKK